MSDEGYELNDPKHSTYYERMADWADTARKWQKENPLPENIKLNYKMSVLFSGMETILHADGAEVFTDEQNRQWIKFVALNGPKARREHIMRTRDIVIVRDDA